MPTYLYECADCGETVERVCTIAEMQEFECVQRYHRPTDDPASCSGSLMRSLRMRKSPVFKAGIYENIAEHPIHIESAQQLTDECRKHDVTSAYARDMGRMFGAKENRWI